MRMWGGEREGNDFTIREFFLGDSVSMVNKLISGGNQ